MEQDFRIRPYSKRELARLYFPYSPTDNTAVKNLRHAMLRCRALIEKLQGINYVDNCKYLSARQVRLIVEKVKSMTRKCV